MFSFSQMPLFSINKVIIFFMFLFSLSTEGPCPISSPFSIHGNISYLFDKMTSLAFCPFDLVFKCPWWPLFISKLSSFPFHKIYYSQATLSFLLYFSLLAFFSQKVSSFFPSGFRGSNRGQWKSLIMLKDSDIVDNILIKAHLSWKLLFHLIKPVCPGDSEESSGPQEGNRVPPNAESLACGWMGRGSLLLICHINFSEGQVKSNVSNWGYRGNWALEESNYPSWNLTRLTRSTPLSLKKSLEGLLCSPEVILPPFMSHSESGSPRNIVRGGLKEEINCASEKRAMTRAVSFPWRLACPQQISLNIDFECTQIFNQETQD